MSTVSKVMISSGWPRSSSTRTTEIIDVIDAGTTCTDLGKFPIEVSNAVGANLRGVPIICGGWLGKLLQESKHLALKSAYILITRKV